MKREVPDRLIAPARAMWQHYLKCRGIAGEPYHTFLDIYFCECEAILRDTMGMAYYAKEKTGR